MTSTILFRAGIIALLMVGVVTISAPAQTTVNAHAFSSPDGNVIIFGGMQVLSSSAPLAPGGWVGYNIYRKGEGETTFRKINERPVARPTTLAEAERSFAHELDLIALAMRKSSRQEAWKLIEANDKELLKMTIFNNRLQEGLGLLYRDRDVREGEGYDYYTLYVDANGKESKPGNTSHVVYGSPEFAGLGPMDVQIYGTEGKVEVTWKANPDDLGAFSYKIYRSADSAGYYQQLNPRPIVMIGDPSSDKPLEGSFVDSNLIDGYVYWYSVVSCDMVGNESRRQVIPALSGDVVRPLPPGPISAESSALGILISWAKPAETDIAGFDIYRSVHPDSPFVQINDAILPETDTIYEDRKASANSQYFYRMVAIDRSGNRSDTSATGIGYYRNFRAPLPPQYVEAIGNEQGVLITWEKNEEEDLQGYIVYRADRLDGELVQVSPLVSKEATSFQDTSSSLSSKGTYWYLVQGINLSGTVSQFSIPTAARPLIPEVPLAPQNFQGYSENYGNRFFWSELTDNTVVGVNIYRSLASEPVPRWERVNSDVLPVLLSQFTDSTAPMDVEYVYTLRSVNDLGIESDMTQTISLERASYPLLAPGNLMVTSADRGVKLAWSAPFDKRITGYIVYRKTGRDEEERLSSAVVSNTTFTDPTAAKGKIYLYSVAAIGADGTESTGRAQMMFEVW
ncbi:MAG: hypothetical protein KDD67_11960 [Ignavibacteriae bacterium]|nr:hypothetical protein [Ignavibacteriota bacterium]MCB9214911.1 hypothetical protein [Ignavibacteria bacterium]